MSQIQRPETSLGSLQPEEPTSRLFPPTTAFGAIQQRSAEGKTVRIPLTQAQPSEPEEPIPEKTFISITYTDLPERVLAIRELMTVKLVSPDRDLRQRYIKEAMASARYWAERYRTYSELADICDAIDRTAAALESSTSLE
jgi:hypothetical protein